MYIKAFLHRDALFEITRRWLADDLQPGDALALTRIISYDSFVGWQALTDFAEQLLPALHATPPVSLKVHTKKELKDFICTSVCSPSAQTRRLIDDYMATPEYYYNGAPIAAMIYHDRAGRLLGVCRYKRVNRTAEKASRYVGLHIYDQVLRAAREQFDVNGRSLSPDNAEDMEILRQAEKKVMLQIKNDGIRLPRETLAIKDVLGMKVVTNGFEESGFESAIAALPDVSIIEKETHTGNYNAVHYVVDIKVDFQKMILRFATHPDRIRFGERGLRVNKMVPDFSEFVRNGADTVELDLILTEYGELVESEIGRSMHEKRIFEQRQQQRLYGNIPKNIEYIIEFLLAVGLSPTVHIDTIPIKIWGRYLPDTLSDRIRKLFRMPAYSPIQMD